MLACTLTSQLKVSTVMDLGKPFSLISAPRGPKNCQPFHQNSSEHDLSALLLKALAVSWRQHFESIGFLLDMELGNQMNHFHNER